MRTLPAVSLSLLFGLAACGGGGGGDSAPSTPDPTTTPVVVSNNNGNAVAQAAVDVVSYSGASAVAMGLVANTVAGITAVQTTRSCSSGGTVVITLDDRNGNVRLDQGETASVLFNSCNEGGAVQSGTLSLNFSSLQMQGQNVSSGALALTFTAYRAAYTGGDTLQVDGVGALSLLRSATAVEVILAPNNLRYRVSRGSTAIADGTLESGSTRASTLLSGGDMTLESNQVVRGTWASSGLIGRMQTGTEVGKPLKWNASGVVVAGGAVLAIGNNSSLRVTALGGNSADLEIDADGNSFFEIKRNVSLEF